jgi:hypothetical protein
MARSRFPVLALAFLIAFGAAGAGAYVVRRDQLRSDTTLVQNSVAIPDSTAVADSTLLSVDTSVVDTTAVADTTAPPAETEPPATTTSTRPPPRTTPQLSNNGALLRPATDRRLYSEADGCNSLARDGIAESCDRQALGGVEIAWVIGASSIDILQRDPAVDGPDVWNVALSADAAPTREPRLADVTGDGVPELVVGWRDADSTLAVDVVEVREGNPGVSLHLSLVDGRISVGDGQIDAWNGVPQPGDDPTRPTSFDHWTYLRTNGRWSVDSERDDDPPAGQL